jgi:CheY-like chemotaxis protein
MRILEKMGHSVTLASQGEEALAALQACEFDLVLMDLQMPVMGGLEATQKIRQMEMSTGKRIPIVAMTAHAAMHDERRCMEAGMDGYLSKPIRRELLVKEITRVSQPSTASQSSVAPSKRLELAATEWNIHELLDRVEGDRQFLRELLVIFRDDSQKSMAQARTALATRDLPAVARAAHTMKGMLKNLAMSTAAELAAALETAAQNERLEDSDVLLAKLELALLQLMPELEAQLTEAKV